MIQGTTNLNFFIMQYQHIKLGMVVVYTRASPLLKMACQHPANTPPCQGVYISMEK